MGIAAFIDRHGLAPETIDGPACLEQLLKEMEEGLAGKGNIPMLASYLSPQTRPVPDLPCCVMDAGGTNLRVARAVFDGQGECHLSDLHKTAMPGTREELTADEFYGILASHVRETGCPERVGLCFSYNVSMNRDLDGILDAWCKEVRVPDAPGKPVGASLQSAVGPACGSVRVLNDSTAALLGAHFRDRRITVGLILGTGINVCYVEPCSRIPKVPGDLRADTMIISTEVGEFRGIPKSSFDEAVIRASGEPDLAHAEKQCAGAYLGDLISRAWQQAAEDELLDGAFARPVTLPEISDYLADLPSALPVCDSARKIAETMVHRAAKIAAILTAGAIVRACPEDSDCAMVIEGSQFSKLTGFGPRFLEELEQLLAPGRIRMDVAQVENSCLIGAALAAFAQAM